MADLSAAPENVTKFSICFPTVSRQATGKISHSPIHQGLISVTYIYPWWIAEWPAYTPIMVFIFTLWKSLCYVMDLKLIDVINVSYMLYRSYLLQILPAFSKWIVKWKENRKTKDSWFWWWMQTGLAIWGWGWGCQNIWPYIIDLLGPFRKIWEYAREISGNSRGKIVPHL